MPAAKTVAREWIALRDGIAHSQPARGRQRTACGKPRIDPRYAHPIVSHCPACTARLATPARPALPWSESELRAVHGDR
jgi:hypothetical protein